MVAFSNHALPPCSPVKVIHGTNDGLFMIAGTSVASVRAVLRDAFNIPDDAIAFVNGVCVVPGCQLHENDTLEFVVPFGRKGVGERVWNADEFCQFFKISPEDLQAWIAQGLKVKRCLDGSIRITETAVDEFFRGRVIDSLCLNTEQTTRHAAQEFGSPDEQTEKQPEYVTVAEAQRRFLAGMRSRRWWYRLVETGKIAHHRVGDSILIRTKDIEDFIAKSRKEDRPDERHIEPASPPAIPMPFPPPVQPQPRSKPKEDPSRFRFFPRR